MKDFNLRNFLVEGKKAKEEKVDEAGPGFMHDCAAHVVHETYGYGICLDGEHTLVENADGTHSVTHYDVFFKEGNKTVKNIPVEDLEVLTESHHGHKKKKNEADVAEEGETVEEAADAVIGAVGSSVVLALIAKVGFDIVLQFLAKKFPDKFAKASEKIGFKATEKFVKGFGGDGTRYGGGSGRMTETKDEIEEANIPGDQISFFQALRKYSIRDVMDAAVKYLGKESGGDMDDYMLARKMADVDRNPFDTGLGEEKDKEVTEDELREERLKKEVEAILGK